MAGGQAGAPKGNTNALRGGMWRAAIKRALDLRDQSRADGKRTLDELAMQLIELCELKDLGALREFGDRMEGKAKQQVQLSGDDENPVVVQSITRRVIMPGDVLQDDNTNNEEDEPGISFL